MNCSQSPPSNSFSPTSLISETNHNDGGNTNDNELALVTQMTKTARYRQFLTSAGSIHGWDVVGQIYNISYFHKSELTPQSNFIIIMINYGNLPWQKPTSPIDDTFPPWWDFVLVGICRKAMMMMILLSVSGRRGAASMMMMVTMILLLPGEGQRRWPRRGRAGRCLGRCLSYFHRSSIIIIIIIFINVVVVVIVIIIIIILCSLSLSSPPLSVAAVY